MTPLGWLADITLAYSTGVLTGLLVFAWWKTHELRQLDRRWDALVESEHRLDVEREQFDRTRWPLASRLQSSANTPPKDPT